MNNSNLTYNYEADNKAEEAGAKCATGSENIAGKEEMRKSENIAGCEDLPNRCELAVKYEFRQIRSEEAQKATEIEQICFPPNEACSEAHMKARIAVAPELFLVAIDRQTGKIAGFLNGLSTDEESFRDEFFTDESLYNPDGKTNMLLGLDVLPEYRRQGLATEIVSQYISRERKRGRKTVLLTCLEGKVEMYKKMGFTDLGLANSTWGGEAWHEMRYDIR